MNKKALEKMIKQKDERYYVVQNKETGKILRAKESYAKELAKQNKVKILSIK